MSVKRNSIKNKIGILFGAGMLITSIVLITYASIQTRKSAIQGATTEAVAIAQSFSYAVKEKLDLAMVSSRTVAESYSTNELNISRKDACIMGEKVLFSNPDFLGFSLAFEQNGFDNKDNEYINAPQHDETGRFMTYLTKKSSTEVAADLIVGYEDQSSDWYWVPKTTKDEYPTDPYTYPINGVDVSLVSFVVPILDGSTFKGAISIDYSVDFLQQMVSSAKYFDGEADLSIVSHDGLYAANSANPEYVGKSLAEVQKNGAASQISEIKNGNQQVLTDNGFLNVYVPLIIGKSDRFWQVRLSVPLSNITADANSLMRMLIIMGVLLTIISIVVIVAFVARMVNPLVEMVDLADAMANGDLRFDKKINAKNDEIGILADSLLDMKKNLIRIVSEIQGGANNLGAASQQISSTSSSLSQGATEQASSVEEVSSTMEQIVANIGQNTDNAQQTEKISNSAQAGIQDVSRQSSETVEANKQIADKISIVQDIAFQTNILALNAAVEAARAGEHGKGFAVVAAEVRKLAERSKVAAEEIVSLANNSLNMAETAGKKMQEILPEVVKTAQLIQEISSASMEQNNGAGQVNSAIQQLNNVTQQNASASEELASNAEEMNSQAEQLKDSIAFFKV